jgi:hypothetical protein
VTNSMRPSLIHYDDTSQDDLLEENSLLSGQRRSFISRLRVVDIILLVIVSGTFGVILSYYLVGGENACNRFFSSDTFGPRFVLTGAATIMAGKWRSVEQGKHLSPHRIAGTRDIDYARLTGIHGISSNGQKAFRSRKHHPFQAQHNTDILHRQYRHAWLLLCRHSDAHDIPALL